VSRFWWKCGRRILLAKWESGESSCDQIREITDDRRISVWDTYFNGLLSPSVNNCYTRSLVLNSQEKDLTYKDHPAPKHSQLLIKITLPKYLSWLKVKAYNLPGPRTTITCSDTYSSSREGGGPICFLFQTTNNPLLSVTHIGAPAITHRLVSLSCLQISVFSQS